MIVYLLLVQLVAPLLLIGWLALRPLPSLLGTIIQTTATGLFVAALFLVGMWLMPPWWTAHLLILAWALGSAAALWRHRSAELLPRRWLECGAMLLLAALGLYAAWTTLDAWRGRTPTLQTVDLAFPLQGGPYLVTSGGSTEAVNGHMMTLNPSTPRMAAYRGQSYAVDMVKLDRWGLRADGFRPRAPSRYRIFGEPVFAPCSGTIVEAKGDLPDLPVPEADRQNMAGNHVLIECNGVVVLLAHFRQGTLAVVEGQQVEVGDRLGEVGNSGNTEEPHLHIHAQTPGTPDAPLSGEPLQITLGGRFLVRGGRIRD